ncbi:transposable element Tcb1 transposase [Trichonephila clavipes]|nr:transposable element Tcb1 transposase [Trichonephila clavipes]
MWICQRGCRKNRQGRSHPPCGTTARDNRRIVRMAMMDCTVTSRTTAQQIQCVSNHSVSSRTIRRRLQQSGMSNLPSAIFQQDNAQTHVALNVQELLFTHQIELIPWPACSRDLSPIEVVWSMLVQQLDRDTPPTAIPDQLWQYGVQQSLQLPQGYIKSLFDSMPR